MSERRWSSLMAAAQDGDAIAYRRLLQEIVPFIRAVAAPYHPTRDRLDDVVQDVLLSLHQVRHTYAPDRPFEPWLAAITRRRAIDALRRRRRTDINEVMDQDAYETFPDPRANRESDRREAGRGLEAAIATLPARQREAVELLKLRELSLKEAARVSGRSIATLKVNMHRALKALQARLKR